MKKLARNQSGVTFLGWVTILAVIAFFVLLVLRLFPLVNEKYQVLTAMKSVANRPDAATLSNEDVYKYFVRTVQIGGSNRFNIVNVKKMAKVQKASKGEPRSLNVKFEARNEFYKDIKFVLEFDQSVPLEKNREGG